MEAQIQPSVDATQIHPSLFPLSEPESPPEPRTAAATRMRFTHGLYSRHAVVPGESRDAFRAFRHAWIENLRPADVEECGLVEQMVIAQWRLKRLWATQTGVYERFERQHPALEGGSHPERLAGCFGEDCAHERELDKLSLHEVRLVNIFHRCGRRLDLLRDQRRKMFSRPKGRPFPGLEVSYAAPEPPPQPAEITPAPEPAQTAATPSSDTASDENEDRGDVTVTVPDGEERDGSRDTMDRADVGADRDPPPGATTLPPEQRGIEALEAEDNRWRKTVDGHMEDQAAASVDVDAASAHQAK
jgi:hypothetical protein